MPPEPSTGKCRYNSASGSHCASGYQPGHAGLCEEATPATTSVSVYVGIGVGVLAIIAVSVCLTYVIIVRRQKQSHNILFGGEQTGPQQPNLPLVPTPQLPSPQIQMVLQDEVWTAKENETCISHCVSNSLAILHAQEMVLPDWRYGHPIATNLPRGHPVKSAMQKRWAYMMRLCLLMIERDRHRQTACPA